MEEAVLLLLCKLDKIYPPGFFNPMQHMILHLPYEARMGGLVHGHWCYSIERVLKVLRTMTRNKNKIEAFIAEAYCTEEVTNFTTKYYADTLPCVHNPTPHYNTAENESNLSLFKGQLGRASVATYRILQYNEWCTITIYVLNTLTEVLPYIE
jgi:hypothetical protein